MSIPELIKKLEKEIPVDFITKVRHDLIHCKCNVCNKLRRLILFVKNEN